MATSDTPRFAITTGSSRRQLLKTAAASTALGVLGAPAIVHAQAVKVRIGFWPVAAGLPFFAAVEKGYFKEAGVDVEPLKFAGAQQVMEAMLSGRSDGSSNGTGSANLAIGEIAQPGLFKIFATNPSNAKYVLDEFIVPKDSPVKTMADLKGKRVASGPGIQNVTLCKTMLERAGASGTTVMDMKALVLPETTESQSQAKPNDAEKPAQKKPVRWIVESPARHHPQKPSPTLAVTRSSMTDPCQGPEVLRGRAPSPMSSDTLLPPESRTTTTPGDFGSVDAGRGARLLAT